MYYMCYNALKEKKMASDLKIEIDGVRRNVRVGVIMRYKDDVVIEISTVGLNSVIPGGRIQINEKSCDALTRELKEELHFDANPKKYKQIKTFENFFDYNGRGTHEIYFLYEYELSDQEVESLNLGTNFDNQTTYFKMINKNDLEKYNLLPFELYEVIRN